MLTRSLASHADTLYPEHISCEMSTPVLMPNTAPSTCIIRVLGMECIRTYTRRLIHRHPAM